MYLNVPSLIISFLSAKKTSPRCSPRSLPCLTYSTDCERAPSKHSESGQQCCSPKSLRFVHRPSFKSFLEFVAGLWKLGKLTAKAAQLAKSGLTTLNRGQSIQNIQPVNILKHSEHPSFFSHLVDDVFQTFHLPPASSSVKVARSFDVGLVVSSAKSKAHLGTNLKISGRPESHDVPWHKQG